MAVTQAAKLVLIYFAELLRCKAKDASGNIYLQQRYRYSIPSLLKKELTAASLRRSVTLPSRSFGKHLRASSPLS